MSSAPFNDLDLDPSQRLRRGDVNSVPETITTAGDVDHTQAELANMTEEERRAVQIVSQAEISPEKVTN